MVFLFLRIKNSFCVYFHNNKSVPKKKVTPFQKITFFRFLNTLIFDNYKILELKYTLENSDIFRFIISITFLQKYLGENRITKVSRGDSDTTVTMMFI